ncbi:ABC transporter permease [Paenibacillus silvae]|uniref:Sugar ABC transporter permease n=1 Tax=Paenibacillus silvae TaxID=1325358 RepID=A0ABQ1ZD46_9BACL|nr:MULTISPECIES: ABC transporter permease subunit [Paenibacillus]MCK6074184.1 ABC transporter permease subunit [Paenibacillus silvae]MCK6148338.1 ABC transporter permease subunit [Paenibacillus silvae]MCK6266638.1 ABC transporter permease subunit [Paenibacillus silvae]GGH58778.1 sugar ABC transporter permease [Paenibacillus silvae]
MTVKTKSGGIRKTLPLLLLAAPGLLYFLINNYLPMAGIFIAFKDVNYAKGIFGSDWVGFDNFKFLFQTSDAWIMTRNTLLYNLAFIVLGTMLSIAIAILMSELLKSVWSRMFQSGLVLPNLISMVVLSYIVFAFLNADSGFINNSILKPLGIPEINWYSEAKYWPYLLVFIQLWKTAGYGSIVYIAFISGIDKSIYEAAKIDGAGKLKQIRMITLPLLKPTIIILTLMSIGRIFNSDFGLFYQVPMNAGALYSTTQTIDTYVYRALMQVNDIGMSAAAGLYQSIVGFVLVMVANAIVKKVNPENALF